MWRPPTVVEVAVPRGSSRLRPDAGARIHWEEHEDRGGPAVVSLSDALVRVILDDDLEVAVPCLDWALHSGRLTRFEFEQLLCMLPVASHCIRDWVDPRSESLLESVARVRLLRRGFRVASQVAVGDLGTIDLVVGDHIALELDGREFHGDAFERDRRKDLQITLEGRHCIRASYSMVHDEWRQIEASILAALGARGLTPRQYSVDSPREPTGRQHAHGAGRGLD